MNVIDQCYQKSIKLLKANSTRHGVLACSPSRVAEERNYLSVFGRDASICSFGMVASEDMELIQSAKVSLATLAKYQADNGQIAFYVKPELKKASFWYTSSIDSTLWWLLAVDFFDKNAKCKTKLKKKYKKQIDLAIGFLKAQENPGFFLLEQNEASDWADIMPRSGYVLNANTLWYKVKKQYRLKNINKTKEYFNLLFDQSSQVTAEIKKENSRLARVIGYVNRKKRFTSYLSFVNFAQFPKNEDIDIYSNILAVLNNLTDQLQGDKFIKYAIKNKISSPASVKSTINPIQKTSQFWREYMKRHNQNLPNKYHNGGAWPYIGGFWVMSLEKAGYRKEAQEELEKLAQTNKKGNWAFNEWFHGKNGRAMGKKDQSWNAGMFLMAYHCLKNKKYKL